MSAAMSPEKFVKSYVPPQGMSTISRKIVDFFVRSTADAPKVYFSPSLIYKAVHAVVRSPGQKELTQFKGAIRRCKKALRKDHAMELISDRKLGFRASVDDNDKEIPVQKAINDNIHSQKRINDIVEKIEVSGLKKKSFSEIVDDLQKKAQPALRGWEKLEQKLLGAGSGPIVKKGG